MKKAYLTAAESVVAEAFAAQPVPTGQMGRKGRTWAASTHYVYIIVFEDRGLAVIKVGITDCPSARVKTILTACPFDLKHQFLCQAPSRDAAYALEQTILRKYAKLAMKGEWLRMAPEAVEPWVAGLSMIAMDRFGAEFKFQNHKRRRRYTPRHRGGTRDF